MTRNTIAVSPLFYIVASVLLVSAVSLVGILLLGLRHNTIERVLFVLISFAIGSLIGDVFIHILPEMAEDPDSFSQSSLIIVAGILLSFLLEKIIHWRHCHTLECVEHTKPLGTISLIGETVHNFLDGLLIAGSYLVSIPTGVATTVAVLLHEIPQEISDYAVLIHSGFAKKRALLFNLLIALTAFLGAAAVFLLRTAVPDIERFLLPLVAGNFLYVAIADLLPELHKQTKPMHSVLQLLGVGAGIALMLLLTLLE